MFETSATHELAAAIGQIGQLPEITGEEAEKAIKQADELARLEALQASCNRKTDGGKVKVHVPLGMKAGLFGLTFEVVDTGRKDFVFAVPRLPKEIKEGVKMQIWGEVFKVEKITLPQTHKQPVRLRMAPVSAKVVIDPKRKANA